MTRPATIDDIAAAAVENSFRFEAKKDAMKQLQSGQWTITLKVLPDDMPYGLLTAPMGTRFMVGACAIGDDETPVVQSEEAKATPEAPEVDDLSKWDTDGTLADFPSLDQANPDPHHYRRQAGIRCNDPQFWNFLYRQHRDEWSLVDADGDGSQAAANAVHEICQVQSRKEFDTDPEAAKRWRTLHTEFDAWAGRL